MNASYPDRLRYEYAVWMAERLFNMLCVPYKQRHLYWSDEKCVSVAEKYAAVADQLAKKEKKRASK